MPLLTDWIDSGYLGMESNSSSCSIRAWGGGGGGGRISGGGGSLIMV